MFNIHNVARNVFTALTEKEPNKDKDRAAKSEKTDFNWHGPTSGEEDKSVDNTEADSIEVATSEDNFFGEWKITTSEGVFGAVVWVAEEFAVEDKFESTADDSVVDDDDYPNDPVDLKGAEKNLRSGEESIRDHVKLCGVFAVFGGFIFREGPFAGTSAIKSIGKFGGKKDNEGVFGGATDEG